MHGNEIIDMDDVQLDAGRKDRCGFPEVIYGEGKNAETIGKILRSFALQKTDVLATRVNAEKAEFLQNAFKSSGHTVVYNPVARTLHLIPQGCGRQEPRGKVAVVSAGTSDAPVAEEALETARWTGTNTVLIQDAGVAGPQRLLSKLPMIQDADAVIVVAGMEGALPSVVGGYVSCPVIAVPTSVGYGANFGGLAALLGMLNSCAANVTVVNIDAGFKAGYVAGLIANPQRQRF
ncbi:MAG: nickel pincer cofactor biosynthesis protein LarB [Planctomycetaceae bacterium]|jgi:NCAIR mutase (PurE)-related protein|nr:nickel pincer cofactor biosynthesis protein LarB [Planctomycetaceae bacterium]